MEESILLSIKKLEGLSKEDNSFDEDLIIHINTVLMILNQMGVGPTKCFRIESEEAKWSDFISNDDELESVKTYIHLKVKLVFDPPLNASVIEAIKESISELEWRLYSKKDYYKEEV